MEELHRQYRRLANLETKIRRMSNPDIIARLSLYATQNNLDSEELDIASQMGEELINRILESKALKQPGTDNELSQKLALFHGMENINQCAGSIGRISLILVRLQQKAHTG